MASKQQNESSAEEVDELLDTLDKTLERLKTLYEQYFLGIQKQPPTFIHSDVERKLRDLQQMQLRNTGLRYRLATLQQKFGAYNSYWRRTLREIENGTYKRNLSKIGREAVRTGAEIPEEILAAMPKRMRDQVVRDREQALASARRRRGSSTSPPETTDELIAMIKEPTALRQSLREQAGAMVIDESDGDIDIDAFFKEVQQGTIPPPMGKANLEKLAPMTLPATAAPVVDPAQKSGRPERAATIAGIGDDPLEIAKTRKLPRLDALAGLPGGVPPRAPPPPPPVPPRGAIPTPAASQSSRPIPIAPGAAAARGAVDVESMAGPFPRARTEAGSSAPTPAPPRPPIPAPPAPAAPRPPVPAAPRPPAPAGMSDADVNALYAKYVKAKESVGEKIGPGEQAKLLKTIHQQAPKIMEQYKAKGVEFSVVVKDNQVVIRAKPKT